MALDPSIILQAGKGITQFDPIGVAQQAMSMKQAMQQQELGALNLQQQRQSMADALALRQDIAAANGDPEALKTAMLKRGKVKEVADMAKAQKDAEKAGLEAVQAATTALNGQQLMTLTAARDAIAKNPEQAQPIWEQARLQLRKNAEPFAGALKLDLSKTDDPLQFPGLDFLDQKIAQNKTFDQRLKEMEANGITGGVHADQRDNAWGTTRQGAAVPIVDPKTGQQLKLRQPPAAVAAAASTLSPDALGMQVEKYRKTGQLDGDIGRNPAMRAAVMNAAAKLDKEEGVHTDLASQKIQFNSAKDALKYFTTGKGADAIRQQETIIHHADTALQLFDALNNGDVVLANRLANGMGFQLGSDKAKNVDLAAHILSEEVGKYLAGGQSGEKEREKMTEFLSSVSSPGQFKGAVHTLQAFVSGQNKSWKSQRDAALKGKVPDYPGNDQAPAAPAQKLPTYTWQEAMKQPKGTRFLGTDGVERVVR